MIIVGIGTDILKIDNISSIVRDITDPFVTKTFTQNEIDLITSRDLPTNSFATRFAGKEAVFKALGIGGNDISLNEIEILENDNGQPIVFLLGRAKEIADKKKITEVLISLSYDKDYAIAFATATKM